MPVTDPGVRNQESGVRLTPVYSLLIPVLMAVGLFWGCEAGNTSLEEAKVERYEQRMAQSQPFEFIPPLTTIDEPAPVELSGRITPTQPVATSEPIPTSQRAATTL